MLCMLFISTWISVNFEYLAGEKGTAEEAGPPKAFRMILSSCYPAQTGRFLLAAGLPGSSLWHKSKHGSSFCVRIPSERWELFLVSSTSAERSTRLPVPGIWLRKKKKMEKKILYCGSGRLRLEPKRLSCCCEPERKTLHSTQGPTATTQE